MLNQILFRALQHTRAVLEAWRADDTGDRPHSQLGRMRPTIYAATGRSATLRSSGSFASRTAAIPAQWGITVHRTPIPIG